MRGDGWQGADPGYEREERENAQRLSDRAAMVKIAHDVVAGKSPRTSVQLLVLALARTVIDFAQGQP